MGWSLRFILYLGSLGPPETNIDYTCTLTYRLNKYIQMSGMWEALPDISHLPFSQTGGDLIDLLLFTASHLISILFFFPSHISTRQIPI